MTVRANTGSYVCEAMSVAIPRNCSVQSQWKVDDLGRFECEYEFFCPPTCAVGARGTAEGICWTRHDCSNLFSYMLPCCVDCA